MMVLVPEITMPRLPFAVDEGVALDGMHLAVDIGQLMHALAATVFGIGPGTAQR